MVKRRATDVQVHIQSSVRGFGDWWTVSPNLFPGTVCAHGTRAKFSGHFCDFSRTDPSNLLSLLLVSEEEGAYQVKS